jgi:ankyrin repeat protein
VLAFIDNRRIDVNNYDNSSCTALSLAAAYGHSEVVDALLSHKMIDVNRLDKNSYTGVLWAA